MYLIQQHEIKKEMRSYITTHPDEQGTTFSFELVNGSVADKNFSWTNEGKEFTMNGELYDVISVKEQNGSLIIHAINDKDEQQLISTFAKQQKGKQNTSLTQLLTVVFVEQEIGIDINAPVCYLKTNLHNNTSPLSAIALPVQLPPPDVI